MNDDLSWIMQYKFPIAFQSNDIVSELNVIYKKYIKKVKGLTYKIEKESILHFCNNIVSSLKSYLDGNFLSAYTLFYQAMDKIKGKLFIENLGVNNSNIVHSYYRVATPTSFIKNSRDNLHIPYNKIELIEQNRFNNPGMPCTYMATTLFCAWLECGMPKEFFYSKYSATTRDKLLLSLHFNTRDLYSQIRRADTDNGNKYNIIENVLFVLPLMIACGIEVKNKTKKFKQEYIISNMLMSWLQQDDTFIGIVYTSFVSNDFARNVNNSNIAIPAREKDSDNYSKDLKKLFLQEDKYDKVSKVNIVNLIETKKSEIAEIADFYEKLKYKIQHESFVDGERDFLNIVEMFLYCFGNIRKDDSHCNYLDIKFINSASTIASALFEKIEENHSKDTGNKLNLDENYPTIIKKMRNYTNFPFIDFLLSE